MKFNIIYRLSDNGYKKTKYPEATKRACFENMIQSLGLTDSGTKIDVFVDQVNLTDETRRLLSPSSWITFHEYTAGSSAQSWKYVCEYALATLADDMAVYFLEDDYIHLPNALTYLEEGLSIADYVSLYDHADKYIPVSMGGNKFIDDDGGEITKVFRTKSTHWKYTNSTTMTFCTRMSTLKDDLEDVWRPYTMQGTYPHDFDAFIKLREKGKGLVTPIPGRSTHAEPQWASPGINWAKVLQLQSTKNVIKLPEQVGAQQRVSDML